MLLPVTWSLVPVNASYQDSQTTTGTYSLFWSTTGVGVHHSQSATWNHCFEWSFVCEDGTRYIDVGHQKVALAKLFYSGTGSGIRFVLFWLKPWYNMILHCVVQLRANWNIRYQVPGMGIIHGSRVPVYEPGSNLPGTSGGIHSGPLFVGFCLLIIPWLLAVIEKFIYVLKRVFYRNSQIPVFKWTYQGTYFRNVWTTTSRYFGCM